MNADELRLITQRSRREFMRWVLLLAINLNRPADATLGMLRGVVSSVYADVTELEIRRELDYLQERELVSLRIDPLGQLRAKLERFGIDVVEYTVECDAGIARPPATM